MKKQTILHKTMETHSEYEFLEVVYNNDDDNLLIQRTSDMSLHTLPLGKHTFVIRNRL